MKWESLLLENVSRATTETCIYKRVDTHIPPDWTRREPGTTGKTRAMIFIRLDVIRGCSRFSAGNSSFFLGSPLQPVFLLFPFFPLFALFCLKIYPFLPPFFFFFFAFVSTFAGAGLADRLLLGSCFAAPSVELTFLLGIRVAGQVHPEPSRSWGRLAAATLLATLAHHGFCG